MSIPALSDVVLAFTERTINAVIVLDIAGERVEKIHVIADPAKMAFLDTTLALAD